MDLATFDEVQARLQEFYRQEDYAAALELAAQETPRFPEQAPLLYYWQITMAARLGQTGLALQRLRQVLESGFWYGEVLLRRSPSLRGLQGKPSFEELVELNAGLRRRNEEKLFPVLTLRPQGQCVSGGPPCPLLLGLHSNGAMAQDSLEFWQAAASIGWLVAAPQSSQAMWKGAYVWDDRDAAVEEVKRHFAVLQEGYAVDPALVVLAGHSMGAALAMWMAVSGSLPAAGFVAIGPGGPWIEDLDSWQPLLDNLPAGLLRGYVVTGQQDTNIPHSDIRRLVDLFNERGLPCELEQIPDVGHEFSPEYEGSLLRGLGFITGEEDLLE